MIDAKETFDREEAISYGYAAYCAGWSAAIQAMHSTEPLSEHHCMDWLATNLPGELPLVKWRDKDAAKKRRLLNAQD